MRGGANPEAVLAALKRVRDAAIVQMSREGVDGTVIALLGSVHASIQAVETAIKETQH
jgi:hypothetical protein